MADESRARDEVGTELSNLEAARKEAVVFLGEVVAGNPELLTNGSDFRVKITNGGDMLLFTVIMLAVDAPAAGETYTSTRTARN